MSGKDDASPPDARSWRRILAEAIRDADALCDALGLPEEIREGARRAAGRFQIVVPRGFLSRMKPGDIRDPLLLQVLPQTTELDDPPGFSADPLLETIGGPTGAVAPGLLRKYASRALLIVAGQCAVNCRYCFRRAYPYDEAPVDLEDWQPALDAIAADPRIDEVILSGGDPLVRTDAWLGRLARRIDGIGHVVRLRVHTRLPIVIPERVTDELIGWLTGGRARPVVVVHSNHAHEIDDACAAAIRRFVAAGIPVLNQAVLLAGVNDSADAQVSLSLRLFEAGAMPYYLHQLDRVTGSGGFEVGVDRGLALMEEVRMRLPGYLVPKYVREIPGEQSKIDCRMDRSFVGETD